MLAHRWKLWLAALGALSLTGEIDRDELECEHAFAHLLDCCPTLGRADVCGEGCGAPTLSIAESECIRDRECDEIEAANICERIVSLANECSNTSCDEPPGVCP